MNGQGGSWVLFARIVLGAFLAWGAMAKIERPYGFLNAVYKYELTSPKVGLIVAVVLPWTEALIGALLLVGAFRGGSLLMAFVLMAIFVAAQVEVIHKRLPVACACFGPDSDEMITYRSVCRTTLLGLLAFAGFVALAVNRVKIAQGPALEEMGTSARS
jgi:hypothetical protein